MISSPSLLLMSWNWLGTKLRVWKDHVNVAMLVMFLNACLIDIKLGITFKNTAAFQKLLGVPVSAIRRNDYCSDGQTSLGSTFHTRISPEDSKRRSKQWLAPLFKLIVDSPRTRIDSRIHVSLLTRVHFKQ